MSDPFAIIRRTSRLAKRKGVTVPPFNPSKVGDAYHVYGVNLTPSKLLKHLTQ